ncbi:glutathione S-transferase 1-like [Eupeodes corollae]|uniref:glutathione S-transferase 1-like n=1 Tax=Eupeodes corollae TaxID=290404 RepID=UPI0024907675|nr:glutathione S-transferase 1-like [Eupeodes corollae]
MGKIILYGIEASPPVRAVLLTLEALKLDYEFKLVNLLTGENKSEEFEKKNPQHTVPVLEDDGHCLWDSHAIAAYLVSKYGKNDALYPKEPLKRAVVDQRLHFDSGVLFANMRNITAPLFFKNVTDIPQEKIDLLYEGLNFLENFLVHDYVAGDTLTIADFSVLSTVTTYEAVAPIDATKTPKLVAWIKRMSKLPYYEKANGKGAEVCTQMLKAKLASK